MDIDERLRADLAADDRLADRMQEAVRQIAVGVVYGLACAMLGTEPWKASSIGALIWGCLILGLARHAIMRFGLFFIPYAIGVWFGWMPEPGSIKAFVCR